MIRAVEELDKIKEESKKIDEELRSTVLPEDQDKLNSLITQKHELTAKEKTYKEKRSNNKETFMAFCEKNDININGDILDKIINEKSFAHDGNGEI